MLLLNTKHLNLTIQIIFYKIINLVEMMIRVITICVVSLFIITTFITPVGCSVINNTIFTESINIGRLNSTIQPINLPSYFSWRDINGVDFTTGIRHQTPFPSCETFAIVGAVETMVQYKVGYPFGCDLSEAHLFFWSGGTINWGSYPENDTKFLQEYGVPDEACWPYPRVKYQYPLNTTCPDWQNRTVKITNWSYLPEDPIAIKTALITNGPVPTYFIVYRDFQYHEKGIYQHKWGRFVAPHYVTIIGYDDELGCWLCKNSWGKGWGENGWFSVKYGQCGIEKKAFYIEGVYGKFPIIYVDDDNTQGPWNGTKEYPYLYIQDGIDNAYEGYTVYVYNGTYHENVVINKTINLDGEEKSTTIINGSGNEHVVVISAQGVRVSGFTIQNSGKEPFDAGIKTLSLDSNATIINNLIQNNDIGLFLNYAYPKSWNIVKYNIIENNRDGMYIHWANNNQIIGNVIKQNTNDGLEMECSQSSVIMKNVIEKNNANGLYLRSSSNKNKIKENNIIQNNNVGIMLENSNKNKIIRNNIVNNKKHANFYNSFFTVWNRNYWNLPRILPKPIFGTTGINNLIPWINFDFNPSIKLYIIPVD